MKKILILSLFSALLITGCSIKNTGPQTLSVDEAKAKVGKFINDNLMQPGKTATIKDIIEEGGLYKVTVEIGQGQDVTSYMSKDGTKFFPQVMDVAEVTKQTADKNNQQNNAAAAQKTNAPKADKPTVELFVMSYCPYGTQIEKGIIPAVAALGKTIDFSIKFCDYSMHGEKEVTENLRQTCIEQEQPTKYLSYLSCFLQAGDYASCLKQASVNASKLQACTDATDKKYQITAKFNDKSQWPTGNFPPFDVFKADNTKYGVQGSPTLVVNGQQVESGRDSASLLNTICSSFNNQPSECQKQLSNATPSSGFGQGTGTNSSGGCATN